MILLEEKNPDLIFGTKKNAIFLHSDYVKEEFPTGVVINGIRFSIDEVTQNIYYEFRQHLSSFTDANEFRQYLSNAYFKTHSEKINEIFLSSLYYFYDNYIIDGKDLPLCFYYVPEGILVNNNIPIITIQNVDTNCAWLVDIISYKLTKVLEETIYVSSMAYHLKKDIPVYDENYKLQYIDRNNKPFLSYALLSYEDNFVDSIGDTKHDLDQLGNIYVYFDRVQNKLIWHCDLEYHDHLDFLLSIKEENILDLNSLLIHNDRHPKYEKIIHDRLEKLSHGVINESFHY